MENILVTGFGPFKGHDVNASWEAVKLVPKEIAGYNVVIKEVEVSYDFVAEIVPQLWITYKPKLVIHVGVSSLATEITIETCARRKGYHKIDCKGNTHPTGKVCNSSQGDDCIFGSIDCHKVLAHIDRTEIVKATSSSDAGRYLCEFIYYTSLNIDRTRTMFIHVPPLGQPYSAQTLADGITEIIKSAIEQLSACQSSLQIGNAI